jgi:RNA polymerase sigma factor (sigma-70 family)
MKAGDPGLHLVPGGYDPPPKRRIDEKFVEKVVVNLMKEFALDPDDVDDVVQTMRTVWSNRAETDPEFLRDERKVVAFLKTAVRRDYFDLVDKRRRHSEKEAALIMEAENRLTAVDPLNLLILEERKVAVDHAIERMPEKRGRVCSMHFLEGKEMKEIAQLLGMAYKTVDNHLQLGIRDLRRMLHEFAPRGMRKEQA